MAKKWFVQGYGMMNSPGFPLTISLILAREAGVDDPQVGEAIEKSVRLIRFYVGKGAIPYGDHHPWIETHEDNGKHRVQEGIDACVQYTRTQNPWASEQRTPELMKILLVYGAHAKSTIPELERITDYFENDEVDFPRHLGLEKAAIIRETIHAIKASDAYPELTCIE